VKNLLVFVFVCILSVAQAATLVYPAKAVCATLDQPLRNCRDDYKSSPITPGYYETSEYLIGSVAVGVIFLESNGRIDPRTENWTIDAENTFMFELTKALNVLASYDPSARVSFITEVNYEVPTSYEPINHPIRDHLLYMSEATANLGYSSLFDYVNDLRNRLHTNWAFATFVVDALNDADGFFKDSRAMDIPNAGGPYAVVTYSNLWMPDMYLILVHVVCHIFYATDEYNNVKEYGGYLNASDNDGAHCIMNMGIIPCMICSATQAQLGWQDTDADGIPDIIDTFPKTTLDPCLPNQTANDTLTYTGFVTEVPYPNRNPYDYLNTWFRPYIPRTRRDMTINTITNVEYRIDSGAWMNATATDGAFDGAQENFTFTTPPLPGGIHVIEVRGTDSVGNVEQTYSNDTVTVIRPVANFSSFPKIPWVNESIVFDASASYSPKGDITGFQWDFGDGDATVVGQPTINHAYILPGKYNVALKVVDNNTLWSANTQIVTITYVTDLNKDCTVNILDVSTVAKAYGSKPGDPNWNETADLNKNNVVNILDISTIAKDYGKTLAS
jgi:hypothetical protein